MEQIVFLILLAAVGLIRWIVQAAEEKKNAEAAKRGVAKQQPNAPIERAPAQTEEERIRRFMEALGVPTTSAPPKPPRREVRAKQPREPKRRVLPVDPFPVPRTRLPEPPLTTPPPVVVFPAPAPPEPTPASRPVTTVMTAPAVTTVQQTAPDFEVAEVNYQIDDPSLTGSATAPTTLARQDVVAGDRGWATRLATPESLRDAIVLREIFGAPRSMQSPEDRPIV